MGLLSRRKIETASTVRVEKEVVIRNRNGLHARPAAMFVKVANRYRAELWVEKDGERVNGKSIMGLMMLAAGKGSTLKLILEGTDAEKVATELQELIESRFGEE